MTYSNGYHGANAGLKLLAPSNASRMLATLETFHREKSELKLVAIENMSSMLRRLETSHRERSEVKLVAPRNIDDMSVDSLLSQMLDAENKALRTELDGYQVRKGLESPLYVNKFSPSKNRIYATARVRVEQIRHTAPQVSHTVWLLTGSGNGP